MPQLGSRVRQRQAFANGAKELLGLLTLYADGKPFHYVPYYFDWWGSPPGAYPVVPFKPQDWWLLEKSWDELHTREQVIKYYIKKRGRRRDYLSPDEAEAYKTFYRSRGMHPPDLYAKVGRGKYFSSGGPLTLIRCFTPGDYWKHASGTILGKITGDGSVYGQYDGGFAPVWGGVANMPSKQEMYNGFATGDQSPEELHKGLEALGAKAWNKSRPKTSTADMATFLGELRELPTMLRTTAKTSYDVWRAVGGSKSAISMNDVPKRVADNFLNHSFGWAPFVGDLSNFYSTHKNLDRNIKQMLRDNGRWIKRGVRVDETAATSDVTEYPGNPRIYPVLPDYMTTGGGGTTGSSKSYRESYTRTWFVGSFKFYIPRPPDNKKFREYNRVIDMVRQYGLHVSPSVIWNLTPWTWLADWFGNAGDIVDNITAQMFDNLTARYAYIMRHSRSRYVLESHFIVRGGTKSLQSHREIETKVRVEANPYGFGLTGGVNSSYRLAILAALGLTR